jgi:Copper amine oxidase, enzyme domain
MRRRSFRPAVTSSLTILAAGIGLSLWCLRPARVEAVRPERQPDGEAPVLPTQVVRQGFPARAADAADPTKSDTAWEIEWDITNARNGPPNFSFVSSSILAIRSAKFMYKDRAGQPRWITPVRNLEIGEVFVPYDPGFPRYDDISQMNFWIVRADPRNLGPECVAPGEILPSPDPYKKDKVYKEVHDDGPRWFSDFSSLGQERCRRGEKLLIWSAFFGANYRYIFEYGFGDDGTITCRLGATAHNLLPLRPDQSDIHLHVGCWRFDPDLGDPAIGAAFGGPDQNAIQLVRRLPRTPDVPDGRYFLDVQPFGAGRDGIAREGFALWRPEEFTALRIESAVRKNGNPMPHATAYDLMPFRNGAVRDFPSEYDFANKDFWVTWTDPSYTTLTHVAEYAAARRPLEKHAVTVWHNSPLLHAIRAEDLGADGVSNWTGVALTSWSGFMLRPRNLFDSTPLYTPVMRTPRFE